MGLKVIGAGFGRTGTDSMREALNVLGFGPCHHMYEVIDNPEMKQRWRAFMASGQADWDSLFEGYDSCVDWPGAFFWEELAALNPGSKVILTWRPAEAWWTSVENTILKFMESGDPESVGVRIARRVFGPGPISREVAIAAYEENVRTVLAKAPAGRLLVHRVGDGWEPLCRFLDVAVPNRPYPSRNSTSDARERIGSGR
jgi:hypothetical protein